MEPFAVPFHSPFLHVVRGGRLLVARFVQGGPSSSFVVDLNDWPLRIRPRRSPSCPHQAARAPSGRWLVFGTNTVEGAWRLEHYAGDEAPAPTRVEAVPYPRPDLGRLPEDFDDFERRQAHRDGPPITELRMLGERALIAPRLLGIDDRRPLMEDGQGGWREVTDLPLPERAGRLFDVTSGTLGDGAHVLIWDGAVFELDGDRFVRSFEGRLGMSSFQGYEPVPFGDDGFFLVSDGRIVELRRGARPITHLEDTHVREIGPGPEGTLVVQGSDDTWIYDPRERSLRTLPPAWLGRRGRPLTFTDAGLIVDQAERGVRTLWPIPAEDLLALPEENVERVAGGPPPRTAADALLDGRSASRAGVAVDEPGRRIALADGARVRVFRGEHPDRTHALDAPVVAVACRAGRFGALDRDGRLWLEDDGAFSAAGPIAREPRALVAVKGGWLVLARDGVFSFDGGEPRRLAFEGALAAAEDEAGAVLLTGEARSAALLDADGALERVAPPPDTVHALCGVGAGAWLALDPAGVLRYERGGAGWERLQPLERPGDHLARWPGRARVAVQLGDGQVTVHDLPALDVALRRVTYPGGFQNDGAGEIAITGLAAHGDDLVVGLPRGNANLLSADGCARRLDPFPDQPRDSWIFIYGGQILIA
ncbi:MAG TPA: hypothetical protein RMH99_28260 [Sandaracinaceae bacterium LLY-WYZ-13_1]|nr:hypothetical protein [Sandaracinaceae bacterium LLY-WYZ-13_1]